MADFTSSLYLGMRHSSRNLPGWGSLTTGRPAALGRPALADGVAWGLARLIGLPAAVLERSTTHALDDCVEAFVRRGTLVLVDSGIYAIGRRAATLAAGQGATVRWFAHHDPAALDLELSRAKILTRRCHPTCIVLADGFCVSCGRSLPFHRYLAATRAARALLVVDDTQALGVLGEQPSRLQTYGTGGGGSLRFAAVRPGGVLVVASLAKAFGAPVAVVAGDEGPLRRVSAAGSALHSSPPTVVDLLAAQNALWRNEIEGDQLRERLLNLIWKLRAAVGWGSGIGLRSGDFPVQVTSALPHARAVEVQAILARSGIRTLLVRPCRGDGTALLLVVTARHAAGEVQQAGRLLGEALQEGERRAS
jgi:8-amino-7-oxononanoate synthase